MAINSRSKGARGEKSAVKVLKGWTRKNFARVPASGGLNWHNTQSTGDVICTTEGHYFPFTVEVKNQRNIEFSHLLYLEKPEILKFWAQSVRDSERVGKIPIVMMRYNGLPADFFFVVIPRDIYHKFFKKYLTPTDRVMVLPQHGITIMSSWAFLKTPYKEIHTKLMDHLKVGER